jgi:hypothetical protein
VQCFKYGWTAKYRFAARKQERDLQTKTFAHPGKMDLVPLSATEPTPFSIVTAAFAQDQNGGPFFSLTT